MGQTLRSNSAPASPVVRCTPNSDQEWCVAANDVKCHVWTAPSWQVLSSRLQHWSVQPCVRPLSAAHEAAGHNALRGSGPGQSHAFKNALALVGCPDRRKRPALHYVLFALSNLRITPGYPTRSRSRLRRKCDGLLVTFASGHHGPGHPS